MLPDPYSDPVLDVGWKRDRLGRWTTFYHDAVRNLVAVEDPLGRLTRFGHCTCGALISLVDAAGNATGWVRDIQKRPILKTYADGTQTSFTYNLAGRLATVTDAKGQVKKYSYFADNDLAEVDYLQADLATPSVNFAYDPNYNRLVGRQDAAGATSFAYVPPGTNGAGRVQSETGPLATLTYAYDALGRRIRRSIDGTDTETVDNIDGLGRITQVTNPLGAFQYGYWGASRHVSSMTYPNGQVTNYSFYMNPASDGSGNEDWRLQQIQNLASGGANISTFDYGYDVTGNISSWTRQTASAQTYYSFDYDAADQLTGGLLQSTSPQAVLHQYVYGFDLGSNRTSEQIDSQVTEASYNAVNELGNRSSGGPLQFSGTLNEPATVTVGGKPATVTGLTFRGTANVTPGNNTVAVTATNAAGQSTTNNYQVTAAAGIAAQNFTYDANGSMQIKANTTSAGVHPTLGWDGENRLTTIGPVNSPTSTHTFIYNGAGQRVAEIEGSGLPFRWWVWDGKTLCQERNRSGVTKRYYAQGMVSGAALPATNANKFYYTKDHLGSIREMVDGTGTIRARYDYDAWGRQTQISGNASADFGYAGYYWYAYAGVNLTYFRAYDPDLGRWLSKDPIEEAGGVDLYGFCADNPAGYVDPYGRDVITGGVGGLFGGISGAISGSVSGGLQGGLSGAIAGGVSGALGGAIAGFGVGFFTFNPLLGGAAGGALGSYIGQRVGYAMDQDPCKGAFHPNLGGMAAGAIGGLIGAGMGSVAAAGLEGAAAEVAAGAGAISTAPAQGGMDYVGTKLGESH